MSEKLSFTIQGVDHVDVMQLTELIGEHHIDALPSTTPNHELAEGRLGSPDLLNFVIQVAPVAIPAVVTVLSLWLTRKNDKKDSGGTIFEVDGDKITYIKFSDSEITKSNDPEAIKAALSAKLEKAAAE